MGAVFMIVFIAIVSAFASLKIRKITVLNALRDGIMSSFKQNVSIAFIICLLSFSVAFSFVTVENFDGESNAIWTFIGMERGHIQYSYKDDSIKDEISKHKDIAKILEQGEIDTTTVIRIRKITPAQLME